MPEPETFTFEPTSRHQLTPVYRDGGLLFLGIFQKPEIKLDGDENIVEVNEGTRGQLELFAFNAYKDQKLFWAIGLVNKINNPADDVVPGLRLIIPKLERIREALEAR